MSVGETGDFGSEEGAVYDRFDAVLVDFFVVGGLGEDTVEGEVVLVDVFGEVDFLSVWVGGVLHLADDDGGAVAHVDDVVLAAGEFFAVHGAFAHDDADLGLVVLEVHRKNEYR